jgi:oxygen-independent coproporphyrinogen-3 oxidase
MDSLGIYISVPFCRSKCSYCNFASGVFPSAYHERYVAQVVAQIGSARGFSSELRAELPRAVDSIYLGGGTPSLLEPGLLRQLFQAVRGEFQVSETAEITVECAPGQIEDDALAAMVDCGVNRVSFGVQSFVDREAAVTGRLHNRETARRDLARMQEAGIPSVSVDLIAGLPHQTPESWRESLEELLATGADHASIYMLEVDEDSRLGREMLGGGGRYHAGAVPSEEMTAEFYLEAIEGLRAGGLQQYEISNFARPGRESVHNRKYWLRQPYFGFGLDAHSMLREAGGEAVRFQTGDDLEEFLNRPVWTDIQSVSRTEALEEAWFLGLRLNEGLDLAALVREFGYAEVRGREALLGELAEADLVTMQDTVVRLTDRGRLMSNEVFERFLSDEPDREPALVLVD